MLRLKRRLYPFLRRSGAAGLAVLLSALLLSCAPSADRPPGEFRVGIESSPASLDPRYATDAHGVRILPLLFSSLLARTPGGDLAKDLAEKWETPDPLTHRVTLRRGVRFHDGSELTSADVAATYRYVRDRGSGSPHAGGLEALASVETPDDRTVVFRLSRPYVSFPYQLAVGILPERLASVRDIGEELVGSGPFRLVAMRPGEEIVLAPFDDYYGGRPFLERLVFRIVPNATTRLLEARSGGLDLLQNAVPPYAVKFLAREPGLRVMDVPGSSYQYLGFNLEDPVAGRVEVRRAVAHAVDRRALIDHILQGQARPASSLFPPEHPAHAPGVPVYGYDPDEARRILDAAGFPDPDGDGPAVRFTLSYKTSNDKTAEETARVIAEMLRAVGIGVEVRTFEWGTFFGDVKAGNFQMMSLRWVGLSDPDVLHYLFHSSSVPPGGANRGRFRDPEVDGWIERSRLEFDLEKRLALYRRIQERVAERCVYVSLWWLDNVIVLGEGFEGFESYGGGEYTSLALVRPASR